MQTFYRDLARGEQVEYNILHLIQKKGNIVVEIEFDNKPSALSTTKADYWIWYDGECITFFKPKDIYNCIEDNNLSVCSFVGKGDVKEKKAYLIKKDMLYKYAITKKNIKWD